MDPQQPVDSQRAAHSAPRDRVPMPPAPQPQGLRAALHLRSDALSWAHAIRSAVSVGGPLLAGMWLGRPTWGLAASLGAFTADYARGTPYGRRAVALLAVTVGFTLSFADGSLASGIGWAVPLAVGSVATVAAFVCAALDVPPPGGYLFVLVCAVATGLPVGTIDIAPHVGLVAVGGGWAWLVAMTGWVVRPRAPETTAVTGAYRQVAAFLAAIGTPRFDTARHEATLALRSALNVVVAVPTHRTRPSEAGRLRRLVRQANAVFLAGVAVATETRGPLAPGLTDAVRAVADAVADPP